MNHHKLYRGKLYPSKTQLKFSKNGDVTWDSFYDSDTLNTPESRYEVLPTAQVRRGLLLPKGSIVKSSGSGVIEQVVIPRPIQFRIFTLAAGELNFSTREPGLQSASLVEDSISRGIKFRGTPELVYFHGEGHIGYGRLSGDQPINNIWFKDGSYIGFHSVKNTDGSAQLKNNTGDGRWFNSGSENQLDVNIILSRGILSKNQLIGGIAYKNNTEVSFDQEGNLTVGTLARDHIILGGVIPEDTKVNSFKGKLYTFQLEQAVELQGLLLDGRAIGFNENGSLRTGVIAEDREINDIPVKAGTQILLDSFGQLIGSEFVGVIEPPPSYETNTNHRRTILVGPEKPPELRLLRPPTKSHCEYLLQIKSPSVGYSPRPTFDDYKNKCRSFYAEFRE